MMAAVHDSGSAAGSGGSGVSRGSPSVTPPYDHGQIARYMEGADSRHVSDVLMREIYLRDNGACQKCARVVGPRAVHFDHITPWSEDGPTVPWNLQVLCESCNRAKGNRMDDQDREKRAELSAAIWSVYALRYAVIECARSDPARLDDTWISAARQAVAALRRELDEIEAGIGEADGDH